MKKLLSFGLALCLLLSIGIVEVVGHYHQTTLTLYSQEDLVSQRVLDAFTKETGIAVEYCLLSSEEAGADPTDCDLLLADTELLQQLIVKDQLAELDESLLEQRSAINAEYQSLAFDPDNRYTAPALWTTMGLLYNPAQTDTRVTGWINLFDGSLSGQILMPSDSRTAFSVALIALGLDVNTQQAENITAAGSYLTQQQPQVAAYCAQDELEERFSSGQAVLAPCYAGIAIGIMSKLPELSFVIPSEGSWRILYSYAIPAASQQQETAHMLLDFLCRKDNMAKNGAYSGFSLPSEEAFELLDSSWQANPLAYPDSEQVAQFPVLLGQAEPLRAERQVRWLLIQESMELETTAQHPEELIPVPYTNQEE
ncbi:MAG: PotD/PotF family extracellular solute-binding protein [Candidatus Onthomonas sp.]